MIELQNLTAGYREHAVLEHVDLCFPEGNVTVLLGPNGCGKSTLLKTALGLLPPLEGQILYDGTPLSELAPVQVARRAAYMAQSRGIPNIEARRMVLHGRFPYLPFPRRYRKSDHEAVDRALQQADALELAHCRMEELSGGQRQKIYLAMALAQKTKTIFMDEPTTWLDVRHQQREKQWFWSATTCVLRCARQTGWRFCHREGWSRWILRCMYMKAERWTRCLACMSAVCV